MSPAKKRAVKRKKQNSKTVQVNKRCFLDLPFDVLIEVFQYLEPEGILYLARTTKALRALLLDHRRSRNVWRTAIHNVGLPPCPDHLSEPAYACLAFDPVCHLCFLPCDTIEWEVRMRCCQKCRAKMSGFRDVYKGGGVQMAESLRLPIAEKHLELRKQDLRVVPVTFSAFYRQSDWDNVLERTERPKGGRKFQNRDKENARWRPIIEHASLCLQWEYKWLEERATGLRHVREKRINMIKRNLKSLGWTDDIYYSAHFFQLPAVSELKPLTAAGWSKISPKLIASLPKVKLKRIAEIYCDRLRSLGSAIAYNFLRIPNLKVQPKSIDILLHPDVRNILENDIEREMDMHFLSQTFKSKFPDIMQQYCAEAVDALTSLVHQQLDPVVSVDPSKVVFKCTQCKTKMTYDMALSHDHLYPPHKAKNFKNGEYVGTGESESEVYEDVVKYVFASLPRNLSVLQATIAPQTKGLQAVNEQAPGDCTSPDCVICSE